MYFLPHMGGMLVKNPLVDKTDLSSLTSLRMTGAPMGAALQELIIDKLPKSTHVGNCEYITGLNCCHYQWRIQDFPDRRGVEGRQPQGRGRELSHYLANFRR